MSWTDLLLNPSPIAAVMQQTPSLQRVRLLEVILHEDGPDVVLRLDLNEYPAEPPRKWVAGQFNTAQLTLRLAAVSDLRLSGWTRDNIVSFEIAANGSGISIKATDCNFCLECVAQFLIVDKITGYYQDLR